MAHGDALIFLTNITWLFFLFLFTYFFFVTFVLPTFYKKFRTRVLIKNINFLGGLLASRNVLVSIVFCVEAFRGLSLLVANSLKQTKQFFMCLTPNLALSQNIVAPAHAALNRNAAEIVRSYNLNLLFSEIPSTGIVFTRYLKNN